MTTSTSSDDARGATHWPYEAPRPDGMRLGISLSGGGIRAATFSLGVHQRLVEAAVFGRARFLSAVSGGSYLASGMAISHALCPDDLRDARPPPWARGSPEETRLRRNLSYLAPGGAGRLWLFANVLYGLILNLAPLLLAAFLCGRVAGILLDSIYPGLGNEAGVDLAALPWVLAGSGILVLASAAVVGARRFEDKDRSRRQLGRSRGERAVMLLLCSAGALAVFMGVLPLLVHELAQNTSTDVVAEAGIDGASWRLERLLLGSIALFVALGVGGAAVWLFQRRRLRLIGGLLAGLAGAGVVLVPFILAAETATVRGWDGPRDAIVLLATIAVIVLFAVFAHNRRYSMHLFYRERIQEAFTSQRVMLNGTLDVKSIPYVQRILLSDVAESNAESGAFPELVVCAAVAARGAEVPSKTRAASFTFEGQVSGNARLQLQASTPEIEAGDWIGGGDLTLPSMMAISGAAVSPLMGRFTLPAFRFLMAMLNVRLGVWIRNPNRPLDATLPSGRNPLPKMWKYLVRGWREPGAWYVLKEGLGLAAANGRYIYVSDGGHWENLGLVELVRRRCTHVVVVDASGDPGLGDIGRAIAVARAELGVEIRLDPRVTLPDGESRLARGPVAVGTFRYPDGDEGDIYYARSVLWETAPSDLHLFASRERQFPNHPTANQFLSGELFDAYRALGWAVGDELVSALHLPPSTFDEPRVASPPE